MEHIQIIAQNSQDDELLRRHGLRLSHIRQLGKRLDFEVPIQLSTATVLGTCGIGAFTYVGGGSEIRNAKIGRFCSLAANVAIGPAEHPVDWVSSHPFAFDGVRYFDAYDEWRLFASTSSKFRGNGRVTQVGHDVWIGRNAIIRQGVTVGSGAIIAAGSFVNRDVEPYTIVAGVPARVIRKRFAEDVAKLLLELAWWNWELKPQLNGIDLTSVDSTIARLRELMEKRQLSPFCAKLRRVTKADNGYLLASLLPGEADLLPAFVAKPPPREPVMPAIAAPSRR